MFYFGKPVERSRTESAGWRVIALKLGMFGLQIGEFVEELVILLVRYLGLIPDIVQVVVMTDMGSQFSDTPFDFFCTHQVLPFGDLQ